ncbi:RNase adapter RapZ [Aestuariimicrobium kwangyangense]|uniref:RNase adapter RapZ n=1 Tax=Aestuariimicrobium kwangyangense TaxID=396389 RepID=UPI0003F569BA|nr:RNase adapter RapZ [Aestuariimicrobium kwangyangense]
MSQSQSPRSSSATKSRVVVITGLSGAGRRTAAHAMEDLGWYVVDNLPPSMVPSLVGFARQQALTKVCVVLDVRSPRLVEQLPQMFAALADAGIDHEVLFLEATDDVIVKRQESSRRPLPLQGDGRLLDAIASERSMLSAVRASAGLVIDTGRLTVHQLASRVAHAYGGDSSAMVRIAVMSFGFKNGLPIDADLVFDVRFLPNPHWVPELRPKTGLSQEVSSYVLSQPGAAEFLDQTEALLVTMAPGYVREGKRQCTIAIGCTGGKHRSTAISEALGARLTARGFRVNVTHRDLGLE